VQAAPVAAEAAAATAAAAAAPPPSRWCNGTGIFETPGRIPEPEEDKDDNGLADSLDVFDDELDAISTALTLSTFKYIKKNRLEINKENKANP